MLLLPLLSRGLGLAVQGKLLLVVVLLGRTSKTVRTWSDSCTRRRLQAVGARSVGVLQHRGLHDHQVPRLLDERRGCGIEGTKGGNAVVGRAGPERVSEPVTHRATHLLEFGKVALEDGSLCQSSVEGGDPLVGKDFGEVVEEGLSPRPLLPVGVSAIDSGEEGLVATTGEEAVLVGGNVLFVVGGYLHLLLLHLDDVGRVGDAEASEPLVHIGGGHRAVFA